MPTWSPKLRCPTMPSLPTSTRRKHWRRSGKPTARRHRRRSIMQYAWTCSCCGKQFDTLPLDWAYDAPNYWSDIPEAERATRGSLSPDFCVADEHFFIRGCLEVPIIGFADKLGFGVRVSQSAA